MKYKDLSEWQKKKFLQIVSMLIIVFTGVILLFGLSLHKEKLNALSTWDSYLSDSPEQIKLVDELSKDATVVTCGTYIENLREINLKSSYFRVEFLAWFDWEGDPDLNIAEHIRVYKGLINKQTLIRDVHEDGKSYQLVRFDVTVSKSFNTKRFPLESHQLRFYIESEHPIQEVVFVPDYENSTVNENITISGYDYLRNGIGAVSHTYDTTQGDPHLEDIEVSSEIVTAIEINRSGLGLYLRCFVSLVGTIIWVMIALFICTYHRVDPLGMMPGALFGTVGNIMVGASLVPDSLEMGLLEYVNVLGIITILAVTIAIININRIRAKYEDKDFAHYFGTVIFYITITFIVIGQIALPLSAYIF